MRESKNYSNIVAIDFRHMKSKWPSTHVARKDVGRFTGGLLHPRTLANLDSLGKGPPEKIRFGKNKVGYPVDSFIAWLNERIRKD